MSFVVASVVVGAAGLGYGIYNSIQSNNQAQAQMQQQGQFEQQQVQTANNNDKNTELANDANAQRDSQEQVLATMGLGKQGYAGTILTSPLGVPGNNTGGTSGAKTILGA